MGGFFYFGDLDMNLIWTPPAALTALRNRDLEDDGETGGELGTSFLLDRKPAAHHPSDIQTALSMMEQGAADLARAHHYADLIRTLAPTVFDILLADARDRQAVPFPAPTDLRHLQVSIFDNWKPFDFQKPKGRAKGARKHRLMVSIEAWSTSFSGKKLTMHNRQFAATGPILSGNEIAGYLERIPAFAEAKGAWIDYKSMLLEATSNEDVLVAPLYNVTRGNGGYMLDHFVLFPDGADILNRSTDLKAAIISPSGKVVVRNFVGHVAGQVNRPLAGNAVLSSRLSIDPTNPWGSGILDTSL